MKTHMCMYDIFKNKSNLKKIYDDANKQVNKFHCSVNKMLKNFFPSMIEDENYGLSMTVNISITKIYAMTLNFFLKQTKWSPPETKKKNNFYRNKNIFVSAFLTKHTC